MPDPQSQLQEDLAMRNAAKRLVKTSIANVKGDFGSRSLGQRAALRVKDGSAEMADNAREYASEHRVELGVGVVAAVIAGLGWLFRDQLGDAVYNLVHRNDGPVEKLAHEAEETAEQLAEDARSLIE
ncbi:hypothetical protein OZN62_01575 [Aurantiacibacter sp. MUD11]|uniref:hypothetical protein n=1 Tax=Aurantiacibacter sp. MUD11 TaxID=3003265 RepID=UPI0022AA108D|nr:hypothetical protein [Aurantiacibacter sp. MUD11]WAT18293.1 hypothetical protein OZN62_01575 [Aurantiacibacter sp. MUD11]